jgi:glycosyltransferase involved in cell wall biosynthesis
VKELYLNMPVSEYYGWGICGKNLLTEFSKKAHVRYVENGFTCTVRMPETIELVNKLKVKPKDTNSPFIHATMPDFKPCIENRGKPNIGYAFYEEFTMPDEYVENAKKYFDILVGGSTWNKKLFESYGINAEAIPQGVDRRIFHPDNKGKDERFIVYSGGKFEDRKAHYLAVRAVAEIQKKYPDIYFLAMWHNLFEPDKAKEEIKKLLKESGIKNFIYIGLYPQEIEAQIMRSTTIGIFPNKCEGGTNLVLMEYLACGNPVIARYETGQKDVIETHYAFCTEGNDGKVLAETIDYLEYAYLHREKLKDMGKFASMAMEKFSWERTADKFLKVAYGQS